MGSEDMPRVRTDDGVEIYYEEAGSGDPILFLHECGGHHLSWEPQLRFFSRRYRSICYAARGWPPSDIPEEPDAYSQARAADDAAAVLKGLGLARAHLVGLSMGATAALEFGIRHPEKALSLTAAAAGSGASLDAVAKRRFQEECTAFAQRIEREGLPAMAELYCASPARTSYRDKDPRGWAEFKQQFAAGSAKGRAHTMLGVQGRRAPLYERASELAAMPVPVLVIAGDDDDATLDVAVFLKRTIPRCGLMMLPKTGHGINLEEPAAFNAAVEDFIGNVERGRWGPSPAAAGKAYRLVGQDK